MSAFGHPVHFLGHGSPMECRKSTDTPSQTNMSKRECFEMALKHKPDCAAAWRNLGFLGGGSVDGTSYTMKECYQNAIKHEPDWASAWRNLGVLGGGSVDGTPYTERECFEMAIKYKPDYPAAWCSLGGSGGGSVDGTSYTKRECFEIAIKYKPDWATAWYVLGNAGGGSVDGTSYTKRECFEMAIKHKPDDAEAWFNLGRQGGGVVDATSYTQRECFEMAIKHKPDDAEAWFNLGVFGGGSVDGTSYTMKECYQNAIKHEPGHRGALTHLGLESKYKPDYAAWCSRGVSGGGSVDGTSHTAKQCNAMAIMHKKVPQHSLRCDILVETCSISPVPSVAKEGFLKLGRGSFMNGSCKRFFVLRDGCLEIWLTKKDYAKDSSNQEIVPLRDLKDMDQHASALTIKFVNPTPARGQPKERLFTLCAESVSDAENWFEAIELALRSMSMAINYSVCESPVFQPDILQDFQRLVDHCFMAKYTRDRKGQALPNRLKVVKVVKVQNSTLRLEYDIMQYQIACQLGDADRRKSYDILTPDVRTSLLDPPMQTLPQLDDGTLEHWLFHGTSPQGLEGITNCNFDMGRAGSGAGEMFGKGIYCAECSSKADEYTEADANGLRGLLLCRAMLGKILYCGARSPDVLQLQKEKIAQKCHTILGDRWTASGTYREYVFSQKEQLCPEFIIYYQREV